MSDPGVAVDSIAVWLTHPNGATVHPVAVSWESHVNDSIHWTADLAAPIAIDWADDAAWTLHVKSLAGLFSEWASPALVAVDVNSRTRGGQGSMRIGGTDRTSYLLSAEGLTMSTFFDQMATTVIDAIASLAGVTTRYVGTTVLSSMRLQQFDVQGARETLGGHIVRILRDGSCNYRIGSDGALEIFQMSMNQSLGNVQVGESEREIKRAGKYTQVWCQKQSAQQGSFTFTADSEGTKGGDIGPLGLVGSSISAQDLSTSGSVWYAAFYDQAGGNGNLVGLKILSPEYYGQGITWPTPNPALTALSVVFGVKKPPQGTTVATRLLVQGSPPSQHDYHSSFTSRFPTDDTSVRQRRKLVASPLWPTLDLVQSNNLHEQMLWEANKNSDTVRRTARFNPNVQPGGTLAADVDAPAARYDSVSWSVGSKGVSMQIAGFVVPW